MSNPVSPRTGLAKYRADRAQRGDKAVYFAPDDAKILAERLLKRVCLAASLPIKPRELTTQETARAVCHLRMILLSGAMGFKIRSDEREK